MAVLTQTSSATTTNGPVNIARTTMSSSDTLAYQAGGKQFVLFYNLSASPIALSIVGSAPTPLDVPGYGGTIATSGGKSVTVPASGSTLVDLDDISAFLGGNGTVTITGGSTQLIAHLFT